MIGLPHCFLIYHVSISPEVVDFLFCIWPIIHWGSTGRNHCPVQRSLANLTPKSNPQYWVPSSEAVGTTFTVCGMTWSRIEPTTNQTLEFNLVQFHSEVKMIQCIIGARCICWQFAGTRPTSKLAPHNTEMSSGEACGLCVTNPTVNTETKLKWDVKLWLSCPSHRDVFTYACSTSTAAHTWVRLSDISHTPICTDVRTKRLQKKKKKKKLSMYENTNFSHWTCAWHKASEMM